MDKNKIFEDLTNRMNGALRTLTSDLNGLRAGRASVKFLDSVIVEAYGDRLSIDKVSTITAPEARTIIVQVWDKSIIKAVEKAINLADLGVMPVIDGQIVRVNIPNMSQERRLEMAKIAHKYAENAKIAVRNIRRDGMDLIKRLQKDAKITEDDQHNYSEELQKITDDIVKKVDEMSNAKEKEIVNT